MNKKLYVPKNRYSYLHLHNHVKSRRLRKKYNRPYRHSASTHAADCSRLFDIGTVQQIADQLQNISKLVQALKFS